MTDNRNISFGSGGTFNQNFNIQGDYVQGDKIQGDKIQGSKIISDNLDQAIIDIRQLLYELQNHYSPAEAQQRAASELGNQARRNPKTRNTLVRLLSYMASNGGIEAGIGKVIELGLKLAGL